jgi:GrpB-like predicted nucleotidyltransferase (UPF0157 family)
MIGLERGAVRLLPHDPDWDTEAERTVDELRRLLGSAAHDIRHVGSTSIPTIPAKPIIDIAVAAESFSAVLELEELLRKRGYYYRPSASLSNQILLAKGSLYDGTGRRQTHFIHVVGVNSREWWDYLNFREYLIEFPEVAREYAELKLYLARKAPSDRGREEYLAGKSPFLSSVLADAREYYGR